MAAVISRTVDDCSVSVIPEDSDDLLALRRVVSAGDRVAGDTTRAVKREAEHSRPDKGERVRVRISLEVGRVSLDGVLDRLRMSGTIRESSSEHVPHGSHHSLAVGAGDAITVTKRRWGALERRLLGPSGGREGFVLVAVDAGECGVAGLRGTHLDVLPNIYSGAGGKRYRTSRDDSGYIARIVRAVGSAVREGDSVMLFGPGETKRRLANAARGAGELRGAEVRLVEGIDSGGEDGIYSFAKSDAMRGAMAGSKLARVSSIIDEVMAMAGRGGSRFAMGLAETLRASRAGAVESLVFAGRALEDHGEEEVVSLLNEAEATGAAVYAVDSSTDIGLRVAGLGGVVAVLRYPLR